MRRTVAAGATVIAIVVLSIVFSLGLLGCGSAGDDEGATSATSAQGNEATGEQKTLKIGSVVPLSQAQGIEVQKWMTLIVDRINEQGGWKIGDDTYKIEYTVYDGSYGDATKTRSAVEKAVLQDEVKLLVSNWGDVPQVTVTITEPNQVLALGLDTSSAELKPENKYFFNTSGIFFNAGMNLNLFDYYRELGATDHLTVGIDSEYTRMVTMSQNAAAAASGLKVIEPLYYSADTVDFGPLATKIMSLNPSFVNLGTSTGDNLVNLLTALHDAGYEGLISPGFMDEEMLEMMVAKYGKEWFEGMATAAMDPRDLQDDPEMIELFDAYTAKYGSFNADGVRWVTSWFFFEDAVNATGSVDPTVLADYLHKSTEPVMTLGGYSILVARPDLENYETVEAVIPDLVGVIRDGKLVVEKSVSLQDQYLASIKSYNLTSVYQGYWDKYGKPAFPEQSSLLDYSSLSN
jgi:branched-chain amino acid transport system substrate-binding protein